MKQLAAAVLLMLLVRGCTAAVFLVGGAGLGQGAACPPGTASIVAAGNTASAAASSPGEASPGGLPARIGSYHGEQITNAAQVLLAARDLGFDLRGQTIAVMTAIG